MAIGLVYAAELASVLGRIDATRVEEHRSIVASYDLPTSLPAGYDAHELISLMARDKKALEGLTFVLDGPGGLELVTGINGVALEAAFAKMAP